MPSTLGETLGKRQLSLLMKVRQRDLKLLSCKLAALNKKKQVNQSYFNNLKKALASKHKALDFTSGDVQSPKVLGQKALFYQEQKEVISKKLVKSLINIKSLDRQLKTSAKQVTTKNTQIKLLKQCQQRMEALATLKQEHYADQLLVEQSSIRVAQSSSEDQSDMKDQLSLSSFVINAADMVPDDGSASIVNTRALVRTITIHLKNAAPDFQLLEFFFQTAVGFKVSVELKQLVGQAIAVTFRASDTEVIKVLRDSKKYYLDQLKNRGIEVSGIEVLNTD